MTAAIYARCSTDRQEIAGQVHELEQEAARLGLPVAARYLEKVTATGKVRRVEYDRLLREAADPARPWSHLLVWSLDRFSRDERFTLAVESVWGLERHGVRFHSLREPLLDTPTDGEPNFGREVLLALLPVVATFESRRRSERVRVKLAEKKRRGEKLGPAFKVDQRTIRRAEELRKRGMAWKNVAQAVGVRAETIRSAVYKLKHGLRAFPEALVP